MDISHKNEAKLAFETNRNKISTNTTKPYKNNSKY